MEVLTRATLRDITEDGIIRDSLALEHLPECWFQAECHRPVFWLTKWLAAVPIRLLSVVSPMCYVTAVFRIRFHKTGISVSETLPTPPVTALAVSKFCCSGDVSSFLQAVSLLPFPHKFVVDIALLSLLVPRTVSIHILGTSGVFPHTTPER
jgi:hypothetical protein